MLSIPRSVPTEILEVLNQGGYSLHIKGSAGTGKTTLALEIVKNMSQNGNAIYLSTRVSPEKILVQFPWVRGFLEEQNILDAKRSYITADVPKSVLFEYTDQPEFLRSINARIHKFEQRPVTVIIDSLDALKANLNIPERDTTLENVLIELGEKTATNMLLITETEDSSRLDYITDGVVRLEREIVNGRLVRKLYLEKIRGAQIKQPYYLFTLKDSRFTSFEPKLFPQIPPTPEAPQEDAGELVPTTIRELDSVLLGGLRKGTLNLFEIEKSAGLEYVYITNAITINFLRKKIPVFIILPHVASPKLTTEYVLSLTGIENLDKFSSVLRKYLYFFQFSEATNETVWNEINVPKGDIGTFSKVFRESITETVGKLGAKTFLWVLGVDTMERIYGEVSFRKVIGNLIYEMCNLNGICVAIAKHGVKSMDTLIHLASTHFVMENIGAPILYGEFPKTKIYAVVYEKINGIQKVDLVEIE